MVHSVEHSWASPCAASASTELEHRKCPPAPPGTSPIFHGRTFSWSQTSAAPWGIRRVHLLPPIPSKPQQMSLQQRANQTCSLTTILRRKDLAQCPVKPGRARRGEELHETQWAKIERHKFPLASTPTVSVAENKLEPRGGFWAVPAVAVWKTYKLIGAG